MTGAGVETEGKAEAEPLAVIAILLRRRLATRCTNFYLSTKFYFVYTRRQLMFIWIEGGCSPLHEPQRRRRRRRSRSWGGGGDVLGPHPHQPELAEFASNFLFTNCLINDRRLFGMRLNSASLSHK